MRRILTLKNTPTDFIKNCKNIIKDSKCIRISHKRFIKVMIEYTKSIIYSEHHQDEFTIREELLQLNDRPEWVRILTKGMKNDKLSQKEIEITIIGIDDVLPIIKKRSTRFVE